MTRVNDEVNVTDTQVTGTIDTVKASSGSQSLVQQVRWEANAFAS